MVKFSMIKYIDKVLQEFQEKINSTSATPVACHLMQMCDETESKYLYEEQAVVFHHTTAQLLFLYGRARRDNQTYVALLTTRVKILTKTIGES